MAKSNPGARRGRNEVHPLYEVRHSTVHGYGAFATRAIKKGERIDEYLGDRVSHKEADERYEDHDENDNHTFLFIVDRRTVIDAGVGGNDARFINHQCDPNCESTIEKGRVFIEALRAIARGEELGYDYQIGREKADPPNVDEIYACRCGSKQCRGTMLWPPKRPAKWAAQHKKNKGKKNKRKKKAKKVAEKATRRTRSARKK